MCCLVSGEVYEPQIAMNWPRKPHVKQGNKHLKRIRFIFIHTCFFVCFRIRNITIFPIEILIRWLLHNLRSNSWMCKRRIPVIACACARAPMMWKPAFSGMHNVIQSNYLKYFVGSSKWPRAYDSINRLLWASAGLH